MRNRNRPHAEVPPVLEGEQRINKILAAAGLGARRQVDELIEQGRVEIDGKTVQQVGIKVNPETSTITVDGEPLKKHRPVYFALHKPEGVLCTNRDPQGRARVVDMVPNQVRLFPVGRLDASSTGLILLTNNGELSQRLTHPRHGVPKRYAVVVAGHVENDSLHRLQRGIHLAEGRARVDQAKMKRVRKGCTEIEITLSEGKNREIRRVLARLGHKVLSLKRIGIGPLKLGDLPEGAYRPLSAQEVASLYAAVEEIKRARRLEKKARKKLGESKAKVPRDADVDTPDLAIDDDDDDDYLPSLALNPYRTEEDLDDESDEFGPDAILVRDHATEDEDDSWSDFPGQRAGIVIADEDAELIEEPRSESDSKPRRRRRDGEASEGERDTTERPKGKFGKKPYAGTGASRKGSPRKGPPRKGPPRKGPPRKGTPSSGSARLGEGTRSRRPEASTRDVGGDGGEVGGATGLGASRQRTPRSGAPRSGAPRKGGPGGRKGGPGRKGLGSKGTSSQGFSGAGKRRGGGKKRRPGGR